MTMRRLSPVALLLALAPAGPAWADSFSIIHRFPVATCCPYTYVIQGSDLKLYGTLPYDSTGYGSAYRLNTDGSGFQFIHAFDGTNGATPVAPLLQGSDGNLYGTTRNGGLPGSFYGGNGVVFQLSPDGSLFS